MHVTDERTIFFEALDRADPADRAEYLARACAGASVLHRRVTALLQSHEEAGTFLVTPALEQLDEGRGGSLLTTPGFLSAPARPDSLGRLGAYDVLEVVGQGGMGVVFRAYDESLRRMVAIKALGGTLSGRTARERFLRESRAAAAVQHESVVSIFAVDDRGPVPFLVMPFIDGPTLQERVDRDGPLPPDEVVRIGLEAAEGLAAAHERGLVHRDIKPANLMLERPTGRVKITDFGLARSDDDEPLTQSGLLAGTPSYMSPEQAEGQRVDHRSDLFSLGSVLYFCCTGMAPFGSGSTPSVLRKVCDHSPAPVRDLNTAVPVWLAALIGQLHAKDPALRPQTAAEVARLLREGRSAPSQPPARARAPRVRARAAVLVGMILVAALGMSEATSVTNLKGTVVRFLFPDGTLVVEVDDPAVSVSIEGTDLVITGAGVQEIRLRPGSYGVVARRGGAPVQRDIVQIDRDGRRVLRIRKESIAAEKGRDDQAEWEAFVAALPADGQMREVADRLKRLNPGFDGKLTRRVEGGRVTSVTIISDGISDLRPVRALRSLESLTVAGSDPRTGILTDLGPLRGLPLRFLDVAYNRVEDLSPLAGMPLEELRCGWCSVGSLEPLRGMPLQCLRVQDSEISDLEPLRGMRIDWLDIFACRKVSDLRPLAGMPLRYLNAGRTAIKDIGPLKGDDSLDWLVIVQTAVTDLSPIAGSPRLRELRLYGCSIADLTPLRTMPLLKNLGLPFRPADADFLRSLKGLEDLNEVPIADFWAEHGGR